MVSLTRYFKLVCLSDPKWIIDEFLDGHVRFGWSPPGTDLREIDSKNRDTWSDLERASWRRGQFLLKKLCPGDRVVVQSEQPLDRFVIGQVVEPGYEFDSEPLNDFNHILHVHPLTPNPIRINAKEVSAALKYDLSKRGSHYEIYHDRSLQELDQLVLRSEEGTLDAVAIREDGDTHDRTLRHIKDVIIEEISRSWPAREFEKLCEDLCNSLDYIEVKERKDSGKGWDLLVRVINPITQSIIADEVPVQCKNYRGPVTAVDPIDDLVRSVENSETEINFALLFILGDLTDDFREAVQTRQEQLSRELERNITFEIVGQDRIAELYARYMS